MENFAAIDNKLAASQLAIGRSSNVAQVALSYYSHTKEKKYEDYMYILAVVAQCSIDNAKRTFDIDLVDEINRISDDMDIDNNGYPQFWKVIRKGFNTERINKDLSCPMNYVYNLTLPSYNPKTSTIPISEFFVKYELEENRRRCAKVERLIAKYSFHISQYNISDEEDSYDEYLLLRQDFDQLIEDIRNTYISKNYMGLMSWLIDRAFRITPIVKGKMRTSRSVLHKNRSLLLKVLYDVNKDAFLKCFSGHLKKQGKA